MHRRRRFWRLGLVNINFRLANRIFGRRALVLGIADRTGVISDRTEILHFAGIFGFRLLVVVVFGGFTDGAFFFWHGILIRRDGIVVLRTKFFDFLFAGIFGFRLLVVVVFGGFTDGAFFFWHGILIRRDGIVVLRTKFFDFLVLCLLFRQVVFRHREIGQCFVLGCGGHRSRLRRRGFINRAIDVLDRFFFRFVSGSGLRGGHCFHWSGFSRRLGRSPSRQLFLRDRVGTAADPLMLDLSLLATAGTAAIGLAGTAGDRDSH